MKEMKQRFIYYSHASLLVPRVARQCMVALCEGAAALGAEAEIVSFSGKLHPSEPVHPPFEELYGVRTAIRYSNYRIPFVTIDKDSSVIAFFRAVIYGVHASHVLLHSRGERDERTICVARSMSILFILIILKWFIGGNSVILAETQSLPETRWKRWIHCRVDGNVCISMALMDDLMQFVNLPESKILVAHQGVKAEKYEFSGYTKQACRMDLNLPIDKKIVCYAGKMYYRYKEIIYLLQAARKSDPQILFIIVGGRPDQVEKWEEDDECRGMENVRFISFVPPSEVSKYLISADLLVMYYSPNPLNDYRSPGKIFEYLASGTPLVASRFRSINEIIEDGYNGYLVDPYNPAKLAEKIDELLRGECDLASVGRRARQTAQLYSWEERARRFLEFGAYLAERSSTDRNRRR